MGEKVCKKEEERGRCYDLVMEEKQEEEEEEKKDKSCS